MLGAHTADIHCLEPTDTAVVFDLDACEVAKGVGDTHGTEALKFTTREGLGWDDILGDKALPDHHPFDEVEAVGLALSPSHAAGEEGKSDHSPSAEATRQSGHRYNILRLANR